MSTSRRYFLKQASAIALGFSGLHHFVGAGMPGLRTDSRWADRFGDLEPDPDGILDLPAEFSYQIISRHGDRMDDGFFVPHRADGMATFPGPNGTTILVRNHEVSIGADRQESPFRSDESLQTRLSSDQTYDVDADGIPCPGGTTTIVYDTQAQRVERQFLSLVGTERNCAGGPTPWGSWLSCEESVSRVDRDHGVDHGWVFEVPASATGAAEPVPLKAMGRFNHEAVAVDPASGIVYQTEDRGDGLVYRYIPDEPGQLAQGGRLQALVVADRPSLDTRNWDGETVSPGEAMSVRWMDLDDIQSPEDDLRHRGFEAGAARFARGEGMWYSEGGAIFFACTNGGRIKKGQIWKYTPSPQEGTSHETDQPGTLELFVEPNDGGLIDNADNLTVSPWGDLIVCEDGSGEQYLVGITPEGRFYKFAHNAMDNDSEMAGATFSPDGSTFFINIQHAGLTLAITGPWDKA